MTVNRITAFVEYEELLLGDMGGRQSGQRKTSPPPKTEAGISSTTTGQGDAASSTTTGQCGVAS